MVAHAHRGRPIMDGDGTCGAIHFPVPLHLARHVTVPGILINQGVHLPALIPTFRREGLIVVNFYR
jgi:hypothetical protein